MLNKRHAYRRAFADFDYERVARFNARSVPRLLADAGIIRNRAKIEAAIDNARRFLEIREQFGSFDQYVWRFVDGRPRQHGFRRHGQIPATTRESDALSKDLKERGMRFVGSTIIYAHMQAVGMVNDHLVELLPPRRMQGARAGDSLRNQPLTARAAALVSSQRLM